MARSHAMNLLTSKSDTSPLQLQLAKEELIRIKVVLRIEEARVIRRCNILNCLHRGYTSGEIADILNVDSKTVINVGHAYIDLGFERALYDDDRSGRPIDIDDRVRSRIVAMVCSSPPEGTYRWTLDLIVEEATKRDLVNEPISREAVRARFHRWEPPDFIAAEPLQSVSDVLMPLTSFFLLHFSHKV